MVGGGSANLSNIKKMTLGIPWWSSGQDSALPLEGSQIPSLVGELRSSMSHGTAKKRNKVKAKKKILLLEKIEKICPEMLLKQFLAELLSTFQTELLCKSQAHCCPFYFQMVRRASCHALSESIHTKQTAFIAYNLPSCLVQILCFPTATSYCYY